MKNLNKKETYYGFIQHSRMNYSNVPYGICIDEIVFGIYVENDGCISEAAFVWVMVGDELIPYLRIFSDGITIAYSEKFKKIADEINNKDDITPKQIAEMLLKYVFKDCSDKPLTM